MPAEAALTLQNISYSYGGRGPKALDDVSFSCERGRFMALLGPNGAGKTTLMALITRLFQSRTGSIGICGYDLAKEPRRALASMGVVFQRPTLDLDLTVDQNLSYAAGLYGLGGAMARERIDENLVRLDMIERRKDAVRKLSGGMRRRVELARALLHRPQLLVLDEPTVGLDIPSRQAITGYVHELCRERELAAIWTTHLIDEVWEGDHAAVLARGRIRADGAIGDVIAASGADGLEDAYQRLCGSPEARAA